MSNSLEIKVQDALISGGFVIRGRIHWIGSPMSLSCLYVLLNWAIRVSDSTVVSFLPGPRSNAVLVLYGYSTCSIPHQQIGIHCMYSTM